MLFWIDKYKSIYDMMPGDRPDDAVIEDDDAFDAWLQQYQRDVARKLASKHKPTGGNWQDASDLASHFSGQY